MFPDQGRRKSQLVIENLGKRRMQSLNHSRGASPASLPGAGSAGRRRGIGQQQDNKRAGEQGRVLGNTAQGIGKNLWLKRGNEDRQCDNHNAGETGCQLFGPADQKSKSEQYFPGS